MTEKINKNIEIITLKNAIYKKCQLCERVQDIYYKALVKDYTDNNLIHGSLDLCKNCGENLNKILGHEFAPDESIVKEFNFN